MKKYKKPIFAVLFVFIIAICCLLPHQGDSNSGAPAVRPAEIIVRDYSKYKTATPVACAMPAAFHESIDELAEYAECIAKGVYYDDAKQVGSTNGILERYTVSTFEVTEAIKGELSAGDKIPLCEDYYINESERTIYHYWNCHPAYPGREYLVFLFKPRGNQKNYSLVGLNGMAFARFPIVDAVEGIDVNSFTDAELNIKSGENESASNEFRFFFEQAIEKYM